MTAESRVSIGVEDLERLVIACPVDTCQTRISLPLVSKLGPPDKCPVCKTMFEGPLFNHVRELLGALREFRGHGHPVRLEIQAAPDSETPGGSLP